MNMEPYLALLVSLCATISVPVARGQNSISSSIVCLNDTTNIPCGVHNLTCPANTFIFILEAENGFLLSPSPQSSCAGGVCDQQCCSRDNFQCSAPMSNFNFGIYFSNCWGKTMCTTPALVDTRNFTDGNTNCTGNSSLAFVSHQCIARSSVLRFDDEGSVSGTAVVARYRNTETNTSTCLESNNTLECDLAVDGNNVAADVRVMLAVWHTRSASQCSTLSIAYPNVSTGMQSCRDSVYTYDSKKVDVVKNLKITLTLHKDNLPMEAWAVVSSNTTTLRMTCGTGTCIPSTGTNTPTQSPSVTTENTSTISSSPAQGNSPIDTSTSPGSSTSTDSSSSTDSFTSSTVTSNDSPDTISFSSNSSTSPSISDTPNNTARTIGETTEEAAGDPSPVAAIVGGVVGGTIAIVLAIAIIVVCYRRRSSNKQFHDSDDGVVNPVALDDTKREQLDGERPPSDYEDVDDPVPGRRKVSYSSILLEADETPSTPPPDDSESDYDHLRQRRPTSSPLSDVTYGRLGEVDADDDPDYDYDRLGCSIKRGTPDPEASQEDPYSRLHVMGKTPDVEPGNDAGIADDVTGDVTADDVNIKESNASETKL